MRADAARNDPKIVDAAVSKLAADVSATREDVALRAGVNRATVYHRFPSWDALLTAVRTRTAEDSLAVVDQCTLPVAGAAIRVMVAGFVDVAAHYRAVSLDAATGSDPAELHRHLRDQLEAACTSAQIAGVLRRDLPAGWLVSVMSALFRTLARQADPVAELATVRDRFLATLFDGVGAWT